MVSYIIEKNDIDKDAVENEVVEGKNLKTILKERFSKPLLKVGTDERNIADLVIVKGKIRDGKPCYSGKAIRICYVAI